MFVLDKTSGPYNLRIGQECYAGHSDGFLYLAVINEIVESRAKVTYDANRGVKNKEAPATGTVAYVPLNEIYNVSWAIQNLKMERFGTILKQYYPCLFVAILPDGKLKVYEDDNKDSDYKTTYDCVRFECAIRPFFPAAAHVAANIAGKRPIDAGLLRERLMRKLDRGFGVAHGGVFELFGRAISVSPYPSRLNFLWELERRFQPICNEYIKIARKYFFYEFELINDNHKYDINSVLNPVYDELGKLMAQAGIAVYPSRIKQCYQAGVAVYGVNKGVDYYNDIIRANRTAQSAILDDVVDGKKVIDWLMDDVYDTLHSVIFLSFATAVNNYMGEVYFATEGVAGQESTDDIWEEYNAIPKERWASPEALGYLLDILERNPFEQEAYRHLFIHHAYPGCGLREFIGGIYPGQNLSGRILGELLKSWLSGQTYYPKENADSIIENFAEICTRLEITQEDVAPAFNFVAIMECAYALRGTAYNLMLNRYDWGQISDDANHPALTKIVADVEAKLRNGIFVEACRPYIDKLLTVCLPLLELIDDDGRTAWGRKFATYEEAQAFAADALSVARALYRMNFLEPDSIAEIDRLVDEHKHRDMLLPFKERARRAAELASQISAFLAETSQRKFSGRPQLVYDLMNAHALHTRRLILWLKPNEIDQWYNSHLDDATLVFGQKFNDLYDANAYYYDVMEKAWIYQEYLDKKSDRQAGLFKKIGNAVSGLSKKQYEPEYMLATQNGANHLTPLSPDEKATVNAYWQYANDEDSRIYEEHFSCFDPTAIIGKNRMTDVKKTLNSIINADALQKIENDVLNGPWEPTRSDSDISDADDLSLATITQDFPDDYDPSMAFIDESAFQNKIGISIRLHAPSCKPKETIFFQVIGVTKLMQVESAFAAIYEPGEEHKYYGKYCYLKQSQTEYNLQVPRKQGQYEIRVYKKDLEYTDDTFVVSVPFTVE